MGKESEGNVQSEETKKKGKSIDDRLAAAKMKLQQLQALKQKKEAREKAKLNKAERAADTRRKVLLGAWLLSRINRGELTQDYLDDFYQKLTRNDDRELFDLPPTSTKAQLT